MLNMLLGNNPTFEEIINGIEALEKEINSIFLFSRLLKVLYVSLDYNFANFLIAYIEQCSLPFYMVFNYSLI